MRAGFAHALQWVTTKFFRLVAKHPQVMIHAIELSSRGIVATIELANQVAHSRVLWHLTPTAA